MLGFERQHWEELSEIIRERLPSYPAVKRSSTAYGEEWTVHIPVTGLNGKQAIVTTGSIFEKALGDVPKLTTCLIKTQKQKKLRALLGLDVEE